MSEHASAPSAAESTVEEGTPIRWGVIAILLVAAFVVILNETILGVAIPRLMHDLSIEARTAQWLTTGFMLTMSVVIPITGFLLERFTTRQVFTLAMSLFSVGTLGAALAPGFGLLLVARVVQASGTAVMMPLLMTTILNLVPLSRRGQTMGMVSIVISVAPALGPTVSGMILRYHDWRWLFWIVLPIALGALVLGRAKLVDVGETRKPPLDVLSVVLSALGFGGVIYALTLVGAAGEVTQLVVAGVVAGLALVAFVVRQLRLQRADRALLDLRIFNHRNFTASLVVMCLSFLALMGVALVWPIFLQNVRGFDTLRTGMSMLPGGLAMGLLGPLVGRLYDRFGARPLVVPAALVATLSVVGMARVDATTPVWWLVALHVVMSLSLSFMFTPCFTAGLNALPARLYPHGSAGIGTLQQVAGAAGAALLVTVMQLDAARRAKGGTPAIEALTGGIHTAFWLGVVLMACAVPLALLLRREH